MAAGALNLASPEVKIHLDSAESSDPIDVEQKEMRETNSLVEEFMLLANISVARKIQEAFPQTAVLRRHMPPPKTNFEKLQDILHKRRGIALDVSSSGTLAASLDKCIVGTPRRLFPHVSTKTMGCRIAKSPHSIRSSGSWRRVACCPQNISAPGACPKRLLDTTAWPVQFTRTLQAPSDGMLVSTVFPSCFRNC
jgi:hypothetical protein